MAVNTRRSISSIINEANSAETVAGKTSVLKHNESDVLKILLRLSNDQSVKWLLPSGAPPYKPTDAANDVQGRLYNDIKKFYLFVEGGNPPPPQIPNHKRELLFIQLLESIDPEDARLILAVKDKDLTRLYPTITVDVINEAFPGLIQVTPPKKKGKNG